MHALVMVVVSSRALKELVPISIPTIGTCHLIIKLRVSKLVAEIITGNSEIMPLSPTRVGSIGVHKSNHFEC
jgi:hypothetical protein